MRHRCFCRAAAAHIHWENQRPLAAVTILVALSGECYEVKAGVVMQCNNCVIHT